MARGVNFRDLQTAPGRPIGLSQAGVSIGSVEGRSIALQGVGTVIRQKEKLSLACIVHLTRAP